MSAVAIEFPKRCREPRKAKPCSRWLIDAYARETLGAKRVSTGYADTLGAMLTAFAVADSTGTELRVTQRMAQYGAAQSIRTIQAQLHMAGVLHKATREQGAGFVGTVYVYVPERRPRATWADYEASVRRWEYGCKESTAQALADTGITLVDVPF